MRETIELFQNIAQQLPSLSNEACALLTVAEAIHRSTQQETSYWQWGREISPEEANLAQTLRDLDAMSD